MPTSSWTTLGKKVLAGTTLELAEGDAAILLIRRPPRPPSDWNVHLADSTSEWWVDGVSGEYSYGALALRVRSTDVHSAVLVRFETDDDPRPFGILEIVPENATFPHTNADYPYGQEPTLGAAHVRHGQTYPTSGVSTEIAINLRTACAPFPCFRVMSVRAVGSVEVERLSLGKRAPIDHPGISP